MSSRSSAVLVDSGSFRVDRKKALDKLKEFQLSDASMFLLPWVEAAVEGGARKIRFTARRMGLEMAFDGKAFTAQELRDPYRCLFEGGAGRSRGRNLAVGILSALRFKPELVSISSVLGKETAVLQVKSVEEDSLETAPAEAGALPVTIWVGIPAPFDAMLAQVARHCAHCPVSFEVEGADPLEAVPLSEPNAAVRGIGLTGAVWISPSFLGRSRIELVSHGVTISEETPLLPLVQAEGFVRDDRFKRNISMTAVVKDDRFQAALQAAARASRKLLEDNLPFLGKNAAEVGALLNQPYYRRFWMRWEANAALETLWKTLFKPSGASEEKAALVARASLIAAAARQALSRQAEVSRKAERGLLKALRQAPLVFDPAGKPLSIEDLEGQRKILGHVPYTDRWDPRPVSGGTAAWTPRASDEAFLRAVFGDALRPVVKGWTDDLVDASAILEEKSLVTVDFEAPGYIGQLGLSPTMRGAGTRVRFLSEGAAPVFLTWDLGPLRLEAVIHATAPGADPKAAQAALSRALRDAAPGLYGRAASLYNPAQESASQAYLREHLLDFLLSRATSPENPFPDGDAWLTALKLFRTDAEESMSLDEIRACAERGDKPAFLASPHPRSLAHLAADRPERVKELLGKTPWIGGITRRRAAAPPSAVAAAAESAAPPAPDLPKPPEVPPEKALAALKTWLRGMEDGESPAGARILAKELTAASSGTDSKQLIWRHSGGLAVNFNHPDILRLLRTDDLNAALPFLASLIYSGANRLAGEISDADDIKFQLALAEKAP